jgi:HEPN domain-containing protein
MAREVKGLNGAIEIAAASKALLRHVQKKCSGIFLGVDEEFCGQRLAKGTMAIEPMLLALSTELALKAWIVREGGQRDIPRTHDLSKLFGLLSQARREKLIALYNAEILPDYRSRFEIEEDLEYSLSRISNAFVEWRYLHEQEGASFESSKIERIIELLLHEFERTVRVQKLSPSLRSQFWKS